MEQNSALQVIEDLKGLLEKAEAGDQDALEKGLDMTVRILETRRALKNGPNMRGEINNDY